MANTPSECGAFWKTCATHTSLPMPQSAIVNTARAAASTEKNGRAMRMVRTRRITMRSIFDGLDMVLFIICFLKKFFCAVDAGLDGRDREPLDYSNLPLRLTLDKL